MAILALFTIMLCAFSMQAVGVDNNFSTYYFPLWGLNHFTVNPEGTDVQLLMDQSSGAGFRSKLDYGSGLFHIKMKISDRKTNAIVTCFYLTSLPDSTEPKDHIEFNYEFLGTNGTMRTNVNDNDGGHREQIFKLWFDPSKDYHTYEILWNPHQIVFMVDKIPIRIFKNNTAEGVQYLPKAMHIEASMWHSDRIGEVDWTQGPFVSHYQDFHFDACSVATIGDVSQCGSSQYFLNQEPYLELS